MTTEEIEAIVQAQANVLSKELPEAHLVVIAVEDGRLHLCHNIADGDAAVVETLREFADQLEAELDERIHIFKPKTVPS